MFKIFGINILTENDLVELKENEYNRALARVFEKVAFNTIEPQILMTRENKIDKLNQEMPDAWEEERL